MIRFREYLIESRYQPLYHGLSLDIMVEVINTKAFEPRTTQYKYKLLKKTLRAHQDSLMKTEYEDNFQRGVSLSRSWRFAKHWGSMDTIYYAVVQFDSNKLRQRYQVKPVQYWVHYDDRKKIPAIEGASRKLSRFPSSNEFEEFVITNKNIPLTYVTAIYTNSERGKERLEEKLKENNLNIPVMDINEINDRR